MLFGYPADANADNWLHQCLCKILADFHSAAQKGMRVPRWPNNIPVLHREKLKNRDSLRDGLKAYQLAYKKLNAGEQADVHQCLLEQNRLQQLLSGRLNCKRTDELPILIREPAKNLFKIAFKQLAALGIRDQQYRTIYGAIKDKVCPFCGLTRFDPPGAVREEDDHYLYKAMYPFAGSNLWNLVPMCHKCNWGYKRTNDLLWIGDTRRTVTDPFRQGEVRVSLIDSSSVGGTTGTLPQWKIDFVPKTDELNTWDEVFSIRKRYSEHVLDHEYDSILTVFAKWCKSIDPVPSTGSELAAALGRYGATLEAEGNRNLAFLKLAVVEMLRVKCVRDDQRIVGVLVTLVNQSP